MKENMITAGDLVRMGMHEDHKVVREVEGIGIAIEYLGIGHWRLAKWDQGGYQTDNNHADDELIDDEIAEWNAYASCARA
jgi:hypothetical protein